MNYSLPDSSQVSPLYFHFAGDGLTPNNPLPVILYQNIFAGIQEPYSDYLETIFQKNNWTNNWRDIVMLADHYHSTTHEVLGISRGEVRLVLGGENGKEVFAKAGDVLIIPAGVGHRSLGNEQEYEVVGGYPNGLDWDLLYPGAENYEKAMSDISQVDIPKTDPVFGQKGYLHDAWKTESA